MDLFYHMKRLGSYVHVARLTDNTINISMTIIHV